MEEELIANNMGLVYMQLHSLNLAYDDEAFSHAMEGLMNAARSYEPDKGVQFSTYASVCIYKAVQMLLRKRSAKRQLTIVSYEEPLFEDGPRAVDVLVGTEDLESSYIRKERVLLVRSAFNKAYNALKPGTRKEIIRLWYESDFEAKQIDIAAELGITQSYVGQVIKTFQHKLKKELEDYL